MESLNQSSYEERRKELENEISREKYKNISITENDKKANEILESKIVPTFKFNEDFYFNLAMKYKSQIENHEFFKDLEYMPKGCLLHHHLTDCVDIKWLSEIIMKEENLKNIYMRRFRNKYDILVYTKKPKEGDKSFKTIIEDYLENNKDKTAYDYFYLKLSMNPEEIEKAKNNDEAWSIFMPKYFFCYFLIFYKNFYKEHVRNALMDCIKDKQYRLETRIGPWCVKDENYEPVSEEEEMSIYLEELKYITNLNPEINFTLGLIIEIIKNKTNETLLNIVNKALALKNKYPDLISGIDLCGDEDNFKSLHELNEVILANNNPDLPWIIHCGETIKEKNHNLVDGVLFRAKRLGHCINLFKLGTLFSHVKNNDIVLEINPISNQTLRQVRDLRLHPGIGYHNNGIKITINNDDPTLYNTKGVNYDFFVSVAAMEFNLFDLKCFGLNSIDGAVISNELKIEYKKKFLNDWEEFLDYFIKKYDKK